MVYGLYAGCDARRMGGLREIDSCAVEGRPYTRPFDLDEDYERSNRREAGTVPDEGMVTAGWHRQSDRIERKRQASDRSDETGGQNRNRLVQ
ncbi:hypothetical protein D3C84_716670 [compost metagenome]